MNAYSVITDCYDDLIIIIIADSSKEARKYAYKSGECELEWIDIKPHLLGKIEGYQKGIFTDIKEGLKRGWYSWAYDTCPICGILETIKLQDDDKTICCDECYKKESAR